MMRNRPMDTHIRAARRELTRWGRWWHWKEGGIGYPSTSPSAKLIEMARVGCQIQGTKRAGVAEEIRVPHHIAAIDAAVESLPRDQRIAVLSYYKSRRRGSRRGPVHLRAEGAVATLLFGAPPELHNA